MYDYDAKLKVVSTNFYKNDLGDIPDVLVSANFSITFNLPIDASKNNISLSSYTTSSTIDIATVVAGNTVTITPTSALSKDARYNLSVTVKSTDGYSYSNGFEFYTEKAVYPVPADLAGLIDLKAASDYYSEYFNTYTTAGAYVTNNINLQWNVSANADRYEIYAKGSNRVTDYILLTTDYYATNATTFTARKYNFSYSDFYRFSLGGALSGNDITIKVVPVNKAGVRGKGMEIGPFHDAKLPTINNPGSASTNNIAGLTSISVSTNLTVSEKCDISVMPSVNIVPTATAGATAITSSDYTVNWSDESTIQVTVKVPAGKSFVGNKLEFTGVKDKSGNVNTVKGTLTLN